MTEVINLEKEVEKEEVERDFLKEITLVNSAGAERTITAPKVIPGRVYRKAISLGYKERKLTYKNDGQGNYEYDEDGNLIPAGFTEEKELELLGAYEEFFVEYFNNQFTIEELQEGLDARVYQETLLQAYHSALGNRIVPVKK
ncbi:phage tail assembly chaperone G [Macrococcus capreoli]|uniref:phage tail assembly chaperone G n=1 Tax=Macrococcus capreoli TaxID=2982690 RepID=UPI003EE746E1